MRSLSLIVVCLSACAGDPNTVQVTLSPFVISSLDGTTEVSAIVAADTMPRDGIGVHMTIAYKDRNGTAHDIPPVDGKTDSRGVFHATLQGLKWDGVGTVTIEHSAAVSGSATFSVLDRTPPKIEILPPTTDKRVGPGLPLDVQVHVTDEIGVSEVLLDSTGGFGGGRGTQLASGTRDATLTFRIDIPAGAAPGPTFQLFALARDLSGNYAAAATMTLTIDPAITIATPPGLTGNLLVTGTMQQLANPRSIVMSAKDGHLYVADNANNGVCRPSCVWRVDATTGAIDTTPVFVGLGTTEGVAVDATSDNLYISDRPDRVVQLAWNGTAYATPTVCDDVAQQRPQDPFHLVVDPTLGILVAEDNRRELQRLSACATTTVGTAASMTGNFDAPRGVALGPAGEIYVSDVNRDSVSRVDRVTGAVSVFAGGINGAYGIEWLAGGTSMFANSLMVASSGDRIVASTKGITSLAAAYLRNDPIDLAIAAGTMYILTSPSFGNRGRIYRVTGF